MAKEICISSTPHETRLAILEDDQLAEIYYERENEYTLAGSVYNGRVTRVLPGMQSAFVDVGLERDAFLYVTDFLEMEDPEESDELEKAAATGSNQAPREIRHQNVQPGQDAQPGRSVGRTEGRPEGGQRGGQRQGGRPERSGQNAPAQERPADRQLSITAIPETGEAPISSPAFPSLADLEQAGQDDPEGTGARRWRGRRRRRGGRGASGAPEGQTAQDETEYTPHDEAETPAEQRFAPEIQASAANVPQAQTPRSGQTPVPFAPAPFVLPGESLSKYGAAPGEPSKPAAAPPVPVRPSSTFKPSTMIEAPLEWDGSGLLPGESLSKHRSPASEPVAETASEPSGDFSDAEASDDSPDNLQAPDAIEERDFVEAMTEEGHGSGPVSAAEPDDQLTFDESAQADEFEETSESAPGTSPAEPAARATDAAEAGNPSVEAMAQEMSEHEPVADAVLRQDETPAAFGADKSPGVDGDDDQGPVAASDAHETDASASHHVDPAPPTGFRLFGLGGKKKTEEAPPPAPEPEPKPAPVAVSSYAPGSGLIEEEVIEEEEVDAPHHHHHKTEEHDLEDYEEETLMNQIRTGDLGELLQEAHLDHRIDLNFDEKNGGDEGDESFDDEEGEDEAVAESSPAGADVARQGSGDQRRDRGGRGRRGRGGTGFEGGQGGQNNRRGGPSRRSAQTSDLPIISDLLKPGQEILVQIAKEPIAKKGARITSHIALPGRFLVFMPTVSHIGVSRKIASDEERQRLKRILVHERGEASGGFIVRTAAEGASEDELRSDLRMLIHLWNEIKQRSESSKSPALIYHDLGLIERILRDQVSANFSSIWVDSEADYERIVRFLNRFSPALVRRVKLYTKEIPLFEHFGIQDEISKALRSKVWLKSGGSIVINQTEALVAIDINTGKYVGKSARLEDTIVKTNLDAVPEIVRQIRLRDLGGIIVIDFIDMDERKNRFRVLAALEEALKADRAPTKVLQFNDFGLVAITRKRVKQSLERTLSVPCPTCQATGMVKSPTTVCNEIYTELRKMKKHFEGADVLLRVNPETVKVLKQNNASWLTEFEELVGKNILVKSDATLHPEQFDIQG
ncbi:MAG: Rne/Rng family ribonuclease [Terracidiphilus sp.]|jgi:ribonuclease G